ncbi:ABC transporter permease/M1 family aminopeptidase [Seonamhaeicola marinus]|uniref:Peptidase M1 membrane alanine aminopeptidase domain-containing protein n=1 Tax=Seonamhaeicola marinus TaxID=1912246 RepID=A0A5D0HK01_9FLAO|nr:M1 family aminopeptidase [Seonamhaeicola marinus]TYA71713.1 hypothetical protein FUA24_19330 [Seonamhaeicola marinus]
MQTFVQIFKQELVYWFRKPITYLYFVILVALAIQDIYTPTGKGGVSGEIYRNSPLVIYSLLNRYSLWLTFLVITITSNVVNRDYELRLTKFLYALPILKAPYMLGRFLGALCVLFFLSLAIGLGAIISNGYLFSEGLLTGSWHLETYIKGYAIMIFPNLFIFSCFSFALVTLTRNIIPAYIVSVISFLGFLLSSTYLNTNSVIPQLLDPFGTIYLHKTTYLWDSIEQNSSVIPISKLLITNRILWIVLGLGGLIIAITRFNLEYYNKQNSKKEKRSNPLLLFEAPSIIIGFNIKSHFRTSLKLGWFQFRAFIISKIGFVFILIGTAFLIVLTVSFLPKEQLPTTYNLITKTNQVFKFFMYMLLTFLIGEELWKRKRLNISDVFDSYPIPNWVFLNAVLVNVTLLCLLFTILFFLVGITIQSINGYYDYQIGLYTKLLSFTVFADYLLFAILCLFIQVIIRNKYVGIFAVIIYWVGMKLLKNSGFNFSLYHYKYFPNLHYSDINGFGHFWQGYFWFLMFWVTIAGMFLVLGSLFWNRGRKLSILKNNGKYSKIILAIISTLAFFIGGYVYLNIAIWEEFPSEEKSNIIKSNYEKRYKKYENITQPEITSIYLEADIFPEKQKIKAEGKYILKNKAVAAIDTLHVTLDSDVNLSQVRINKKILTPILVDKPCHRYMFAIKPALEPKDSICFQFQIEKQRKGFGTNHFDVVGNGTFIDRGSFMPSILGYSFLPELRDNKIRHEFGLSPKNGTYPTLDRTADLIPLSSSDIVFEAIISTSERQTALTKGQLINTWKKDNRNYFHYKTKKTTSKEYALFSGEYQVEKSIFKLDSTQTVNLEILYNGNHKANVDEMMRAVKETLAYCHKNFGNYHSESLKLVEVPGFRPGARSFPQTIALFEKPGFTYSNTRENKNLPFFIVAHETAHQWFGSQGLVRQPVKGANMVNETLAQYAALMVLKQKYGMEEVRKWLKFSMKSYAKGHVNNLKEVPLKQVENENYIYYDKGALAMFALQEYIGEEKVNKAVSECIQKNLGHYTNSMHLISSFKAEAPEAIKQKITELFEKVVVYDNSIKKAKAKFKNTNKYELTLDLDAHKYDRNKSGIELEFTEGITIEVETKGGVEMFKVLVSNGINSLVMPLKDEPLKIFLDPNFVFLDKNLDDNTLVVTVEGE